MFVIWYWLFRPHSLQEFGDPFSFIGKKEKLTRNISKIKEKSNLSCFHFSSFYQIIPSNNIFPHSIKLYRFLQKKFKLIAQEKTAAVAKIDNVVRNTTTTHSNFSQLFRNSLWYGQIWSLSVISDSPEVLNVRSSWEWYF